MNRAFIDLLSNYPTMLDAFNQLPEYDKRALCSNLRGCVVSQDEEEAIITVRHAGLLPTEDAE